MKNLLLGIALSAVIGFGSTVQALTLNDKTKVESFTKGGDKKKKNKKKDCADMKDKKGCCASKGEKKDCGAKTEEAK